MIDEDILEKADEMIRLFQAELYKLCEKSYNDIYGRWSNDENSHRIIFFYDG